jgi:hypothetical protein
MSTCRTFALPVAAVLATLLAGSAAQADCSEASWKDCAGKPWVTGKPDTPIGEAWWPSKLWGADDEAGSTNWFTKPEDHKRGHSEVSEGKVYSLGHPYTTKMPLFGSRTFTLRIPGRRPATFGANKMVCNDEFIATQVGQIGTQFDGLGHIGVQIGEAGEDGPHALLQWRTMAEIGGETGLKRTAREAASDGRARRPD